MDGDDVALPLGLQAMFKLQHADQRHDIIAVAHIKLRARVAMKLQ